MRCSGAIRFVVVTTVGALVATSCTDDGGESRDRLAPGPEKEATGEVLYAHDEAGRLAAAFTASGAGVRYTYDEDDNITAISDLPADELAVVQAGPSTLVAGDAYTIYGTGFGTDQGAVDVSIGDTDAPVSSFRASRIVVEVPEDAESGDVEVSVDGDTVKAGAVTVLHEPQISGVEPALVDGSGTLTVSGSGFDTMAGRNTVTVGGTRVRVSEATESKLTVQMPASGGIGSIRVRNRAGSASSDDLVTVPPTPFLAADVADVRPLTFGKAEPIETSTVNQIALFYAKPDAGKRLSFKLKQSFEECVELHVWAPDRSPVYREEKACDETVFIDLPDEAVDGYYLLQVDPREEETGTATATAAQATDTTKAITLNGSAGTTKVKESPGHALFTFAGSKGDRVFTTVTQGPDDYSASADAVALRGPSGQTLASNEESISSEAYLPAATLPETGTYTVDVDPDDWERGSFTAKVNTIPDPVLTSTTLDGGPATIDITKPGQTASISLQGKRGQTIHVDIDPRNESISTGTATLRGPDGAFLFREQSWSSFEDDSVDRYQLPQTGEYLMLFEPDDAQTGTVRVTATTVPADTVAESWIDAPGRRLSNTKPGQNARLTFNAAAGREVFVTCTAADDVNYRLLDPDGEDYLTGSCSDGVAMYAEALETGGRWTVVADFTGSRIGATTVRVLGVPNPVRKTTRPDAASTHLSLAPGQRGIVTFPVRKGKRFFVTCAMDDPDQEYGVDFELTPPGEEDGDFSSCASIDKGQLFETTEVTADGTWTITATSTSAQQADFRLRVRSVPDDIATSTTVGGTGRDLHLMQGQNATVTFDVDAGQRLLVACNLGDEEQKYDIDFTVRKPGGHEESTEDCYEPPDALLDVTTAKTAGTWSVTIDPADAISARVRVRVYAVPDDVRKQGRIGGPAVPVATESGQRAQVTFHGRAGQEVAVTTPTATYADCVGDFRLLGPSGNEIDSTCLSESTYGISTRLPSTGTYTAVIDPDGATSGSASVKIAIETGFSFAPADFNGPLSFAPQRKASPYPTERPASLTGRMLRTDGTPLAGVRVSVVDRESTTGADGRFRLIGLPEGTWLLVMDGRAVGSGYFDVQVGLHSGANRLHYQPYLPMLDKQHEIAIDSPTTRDVVLTTPKVPGLEVHIPKGTTITDADGNPVDHLGITPIPVKRTPIPMPQGVQVPVYFTVQPAGGEISGGGTSCRRGRECDSKVQIYYPNYLDQEPGTQINFWTHEKRAEGWEVYGSGYVNGEGTQVIPSEDTFVDNFDGAMINVPGWLKGLLRGVLEALGAAGDPVDLGTGRFTYSQTDLSLGGNIPIQLERGYSSGDGQDRSFGMGTFGTYDTFLSSDQHWEEADLNLTDGSTVHYERTSPGNGFTDAIMEARTASPQFAGSTVAWNGLGWDLKLRDGTVLVYGDLAPLQSIRDKHGHTVEIRRTATNGFGSQIGAIKTVTSSDGYWLAFTYDKNDHVTAVRDNAGRTVRYAYDARGRLRSVRDVNGGITRYGWDSADRITRIVDAKGQTFLTNSYDGAGRVTKQVLADGSTYTFDYETEGSRIVQTTVTDPAGQKRITQYDEHGYLIGETQAAGSEQESSYTVKRDSSTHVPLTVSDSSGVSTTSTYDAYLRATKTVDRTEGERREETATYNGPDGAIDSVTDPLGNTTKFGFDDDGNVNRIVDPGGRTTGMTWNRDGLPATLTDPAGATTRFEWLAGALTAVEDANGRRTEYLIDDVGRTVQTISPDGGVIGAEFGAANQLLSTTDPLGRKTEFGYDANGNLTSLTAPSGATWQWKYDSMDRVVREVDPHDAETQLSYTALGQVKSVTDRGGATTEYGYDALGRTSSVGWRAPGDDDYESMQKFSYDERDRLMSIEDSAPGAGSVEFEYDEWDHVVKETSTADGGAGTITRGWDDADRLVSKQVSGLPEVRYTYDESDQLTTIEQGSVSSALTYDKAGRLKSQTMPGGITRVNAYDTAGDLMGIRYLAGEEAIGTVSYGYDDAGRLASTGGSLSRADLPGAYEDAQVGTGSRLDGAGGSRFTYDEAGNLTRAEAPDGAATTYEWDARGRLVGTGGEGADSTIQYDALGRRTSTTIGDDTFGFRYDGMDLVAQDAPGSDGDLVFARDQIVDRAFATIGGSNSEGAPDASGDVSALLTDRLGSVLERRGQSDSATYTYGVAGTASSSAENDPNPVRYTGRESGPGVPAGLQYNRARWYDPETARFISEDPAGNNGSGINLYAYAATDPVDYTDPTGEVVPQLVGACVAGGVINTLAGMLLGRKHSVGDYLRGLGKGCVEGLLMFGAGKIVSMTLRSAVRAAKLTARGRGSLTVVGTRFSQSERDVAEYLAQQGKRVVLREAPPNAGRTSDLLVNGIAYDVYTPTTGNVGRIVSAIAKKGSQVRGGGVVIDLRDSSLTPADLSNILARVQGITDQISDIIVMG